MSVASEVRGEGCVSGVMYIHSSPPRSTFASQALAAYITIPSMPFTGYVTVPAVFLLLSVCLGVGLLILRSVGRYSV